MNRLKIAAMAACAALSLAACESLTGGPLIRPGEPTGYIRINNQSSVPIDVVTMSDCDANTYGFNRLPSGGVLYPGQYWDVQVSSGCWDIGVGKSGVQVGNEIQWYETYQRVNVSAGGYTQYTLTD